jgi:hypothetical protein
MQHPAFSKAPTLVNFRGGFVADWQVVNRLLGIEARGARFELLADGRFRVIPSDALTLEDVEFLRARRVEARQVLEYQADGSHLHTA